MSVVQVKYEMSENGKPTDTSDQERHEKDETIHFFCKFLLPFRIQQIKEIWGDDQIKVCSNCNETWLIFNERGLFE